MYICNCCEKEFHTPVEVIEVHFECTELPKEYFYECPYCRSLDIDKENDDD